MAEQKTKSLAATKPTKEIMPPKTIEIPGAKC